MQLPIRLIDPPILHLPIRVLLHIAVADYCLLRSYLFSATYGGSQPAVGKCVKMFRLCHVYLSFALPIAVCCAVLCTV